MDHELRADLAKSARKGDLESFSLLFEDIRIALYAKALQFFGHGSQAEDAVQNTYLIAFSRIHQLREPLKFNTWTHRILYHHCLRLLRDEKRTSELHKLTLMHRSAQTDPIRELLEREELHQQSRALLARLPEKKRLVALLRYFSEFNSYCEIAAILGVAVGTVKSRLAAARHDLKNSSEVRDSETLHSGQSKEKEEMLKQAWDEFYRGQRSRFLSCFRNDISIRFTSGKEGHGLRRWAAEWDIDLESGARFKTNTVVNADNISIVEGPIINPPENPGFCPPGGSMVLFHRNEKIERVHIHYAKRDATSY